MEFNKPVELNGRYARLIPLIPDHAQALIDVANMSRNTFAFTGVPNDRVSAEKYIQRAIEQQRTGTGRPFSIVEKSSGKIVGSTRFMNIELWEYPAGHSLNRTTPHAVEIGATWLGEPYQRSGINTDCKLCLLSFAFEEWKVMRVSLKTDARNSRSRANIERAGAQFDGVIRAHMPSFDGGIRDTAFYSILATEWPQVKSRLQGKLR